VKAEKDTSCHLPSSLLNNFLVEETDYFLSRLYHAVARRLYAARGSPIKLSDDGAPVVGEICRNLDGLALAIELAAGRVIAHGFRGTAALLDNRFKLEWQGRRTALPPASNTQLHVRLEL
jgi:predicted ATPase